MLTKPLEGKLLFWGARHLGGGESIKPVTHVTKPYYRPFGLFFIFIF